MPLQKQNISVPMLSMDESVDERVLPVDTLRSVKNGQYDKRGSVVKRNGFRRFPNELSDGTPIDTSKTLFSTGDELCLVGNTRLYAYNEKQAVWYDHGPVSPCTGKTENIFRDVNNYALSDIARNGDYVIHAAHQTHVAQQVVGGNDEVRHAIDAQIQTVDGQQVLFPEEIDPFTTTNFTASRAPHAPRCFATGSKLCFLHQRMNVGLPNTLFLHEWDSNTPNVPFNNFGAMTFLPNDLWFNGENTRTYDAVGIEQGIGQGDYLLAYIADSSNSIIIARRDSSHAVQALGNINVNAPYERVALADSTQFPDVFYVIAVAARYAPGPILNSWQVEVWALQKSNMAVVWGPVALRSSPGPLTQELVRSVGCCENDGRLVGTWSVTKPEIPATLACDTENRSCDGLTGGALDRLWVIKNCYLRTRPFSVNNRAYQWLGSAISDAEPDEFNGGTELFECEWLADLMTDDVNPVVIPNWPRRSRLHVFCGLHNVGVAPAAVIDGTAAWVVGSGNNIIHFGDDVYKNMTTSRSFYMEGRPRRHAADEVTLDFREAPLATVVNRGSAIIGGAAWFWYSGSWTEEVSFAYPPVINVPVITPNPGGLAAGTYFYTSHWSTYDEKGNLHRSLPTASVEVEIIPATAPANVTMQVKTLSASTRLAIPNKDVNAVWYRSTDSDPIKRRISRPTLLCANTPMENLTNTSFIDEASTVEGNILYTDGGVEIEAVAPEGGRIPFVAANRVWLGDFFRRDRIQYSKRYAPGTANEDSIAPEFNEAFGYLVRSGRRITGMSELDDKLVVFTEEEIFALAGRGPDDSGANNDFSGLQEVSNDGGCIEARSVVAFPGGVMFQSKAGVYALTRNLSLEFLGRAVEDKLAEYPIITAATLVSKVNEVRFVASNGTRAIILVFNYKWGAWSWWEPRDAVGGQMSIVSAAVHNNEYYVVSRSGNIFVLDAALHKDDTTEYIPLEVETSWLQSAGQSGWQRIWNITALCDRKDAHDLTMTVYNDFDSSPSQTVTWSDATIAAFPELPREQVKTHVLRQKCQAVKVKIADADPGVATTGAGFDIAGIVLEAGVKRGQVKVSRGQRN